MMLRLYIAGLCPFTKVPLVFTAQADDETARTYAFQAARAASGTGSVFSALVDVPPVCCVPQPPADSVMSGALVAPAVIYAPPVDTGGSDV